MKRILGIFFALMVALSLVLMPAGVAQSAPDLYENYTTGDDTYVAFWSSKWSAQTFTAVSNHSVTSVKLKLLRDGLPGTVTVSITATDGSGHPTGSDLTSGTTDGDTLTTAIAGEWREITLTSYNLTSGTKYAIVVKALSGDSSNLLGWRANYWGGYAGGNWEESTDSGASWVTYTLDLMFEVHGSPTLVGVDIDIKPGSDPNSINPKSKGVIPVAILTTPDFDATTVDAETVRFGPAGAEPVHWALEDVDGDGDTDMILHFRTQDTGIAQGDTSATLTGETYGGDPIAGTDPVNIVGK